jgi:hypothetical protein
MVDVRQMPHPLRSKLVYGELLFDKVEHSSLVQPSNTYECSLLSLLPPETLQLPTNNARTALTGLWALDEALAVAIKAIEHFLTGRLCQLDAMAGTNCCHITALANISASEHASRDPDLSQRLRLQVECLRERQMLVRRIAQQKGVFRDLSLSLAEFLRSNDCELALHPLVLYLTAAHGSTLAKKRVGNINVTNYSRLHSMISDLTVLPLTRGNSTRLIKYWQRLLASSATCFVQEEAARVSPNCSEWATYVAPEYVVKDSVGRQCVSNLYSMRIVMDRLLAMRSLTVVVRRHIFHSDIKQPIEDCYYYQADSSRNGLTPLRLEYGYRFDDRSVVMVLEGCTYNNDIYGLNSYERRMEFMKHDLLQLVYANDVHYPEFPPGTQCEPIHRRNVKLDKEISALATIPGTTIQDASLFCLTHLYADTHRSHLSGLRPAPHYLPNHQEYHQTHNACSRPQ